MQEVIALAEIFFKKNQKGTTAMRKKLLFVYCNRVRLFRAVKSGKLIARTAMRLKGIKIGMFLKNKQAKSIERKAA